MNAVLGRDAQRVLRRIGGWTIAHLLTNPDDWSTDIGGSSHFDVFDDERDWLEYNATGLTVGRLGAQPRFELRWSKVKAYARTLPAGLLDQLRANHQAIRDHRQTYPVFAATGDAVGCGPIPHWGPLTRRQALYVAQHDTWLNVTLPPWKAHLDDLEAERGRLLDEAFPLAAGYREPTDLLELLEAVTA